MAHNNKNIDKMMIELLGLKLRRQQHEAEKLELIIKH
jgi:hypothetical protein